MSETPAWVALIAAFLAFLGGGWNLYQAHVSKKLGVKQNDIEQESSTVTGLKELAILLRSEVDSLRADRDEDREAHAESLTALRDEIADMRGRQQELLQENREFRMVILGVVEQLRRIPPPTHQEIRDFILAHLPWIGRDKE